MRTFIAIELEPEIREKLAGAQERLRSCGVRVRWTQREQMHVTLKFVGEIEAGQVEDVSEAIASVCAECEPFDLGVQRLEAFPRRGAPRVVWAGVSEPSGVLASLQERLEEDLERLGVKRERRGFTAHVTLGRVKDRKPGGLREAIARGAQARFGRQAVSDVVLMQSTLTPQGAVYTELFRAELTRAEGQM